jgi:hypothetical protein
MAVVLATEIAKKIHAAFVAYAPSYDVQPIQWDDLEEYQRQLAVTMIADVIGKGYIAPGPELEKVETDARSQ